MEDENKESLKSEGLSISSPLWFLVFIFLSAAILLAYYHLWIAAFLIGGALLIAAFISEKYSRAALIGIGTIAAGLLYCALFAAPIPGALPALNETEIEGRVKDYPRFDGQKSDFSIITKDGNRYTRCIKVYCNFPVTLQKGDQIRINGTLKPPARAGNPGEFDYQAYLAQNGIYYIMSVQEEKDVQIRASAASWQRMINSYRSHSQELIKEVLPPDEAALLLGMLLGIIETIDSDEYSDYQKTGIVHIFSVSGLHVGFLLVLTAWLVSLLGLSRRARLVSSITVLILYASLVGWPVPVVRSVIMGVLGLIAYYSGRENQLLNALGLAGIIVLLMNPWSLLQISFQLSFAAAWGLVYLFPLLRAKMNYKGRLVDLLLIPVCAQLATLPLTAFHFNLFSPLALLANIPVTYLSGAAVMLGFFTLLAGVWLPALASLFLYPAGLCIELIRIVNQLVVNIPAAYLRVATPEIALMVIYYGGLILLAYALARNLEEKPQRRLAIGGALMVFIFVLILCLPGSVYNRGKVELTFIDVGQGDSILLKTPQGKFILIDGGGSDFTDPGSRKVLPYLYHRGVRELFLVINSHPDIDHRGGLEPVLREIPAGAIIVSDSMAGAEEYQEMKRIAQAGNIPIRTVAEGYRINTGEGVEIKVLSPPPGPGNDSNEASVVLDIRYKNFSTLLTGDIGSKTMQTLLDQEAVEQVSILKIPHHGSKNSLSTAFYEKSAPRWAVISAGANNLFGHPHPAILEALESRDIKILRTDQDGAVMFESDGERVRISTVNHRTVP